MAVTTIKAREHETVPISGDLIFKEGRIDLYPDLQGERLFKLSLRNSGVVIQPSGYIGFIPLNAFVALEVAPRIPVANVEYLLAKSGLTPAITLPFVRQFGETNEAAAPFLMLLAMRFDGLLRELHFEGLFKSYALRRHTGSNPGGHLFPLSTALRSRTSGRAIAVFERFDRTLDNAINQLIVAAGQKILGSSLFKSGTANAKLRKSLQDGLMLLAGVSRVSEPIIPAQTTLPSNRPILRQLLRVCVVILRNQGVRLRGEGTLRLPTFLIQMDKVFENYVRRTLQEEQAHSIGLVLDGNLKPPIGAEKPLYANPGPLGNRVMSPDILLAQGDEARCIIEIKYKPCPRQPDREHVEQLLTYALAYNASRAALLYPAAERQTTALTKLGNVNGIECYKITFDISADDLNKSEQKLRQLVREEFMPPSLTNS